MVTLSDSSVVDLVSQARLVFMRPASSCDTCDTKFYTSENREKKRGLAADAGRYMDFSVTSVTLSANPIVYAAKSVTLDCPRKRAFVSQLKKKRGGA